jgi:hypothetical protein
MAGWEDLGAALGGSGGATYEKAFQEGRYRSAQTEEALQTARVKQAESLQREAANKATTELMANPKGLSNPDDAMMALIMAAQAGDQYKNLSSGMGEQQNIRFRDRVANPETPAETRLRTLQAIEGKPSADVVAVGANDFVNLADELQVPTILDSAAKELAATGGPNATPALKNFRAAQQMTPQERAMFEPYVRSDTIINAGGVPTNAGFGGRGTPAPIVAPTTAATNAAQIAQGKAEGTAKGQQIAAIPGKEDKIDAFMQGIDGFLADPGFPDVYGKSGSAYELAGRLAPAQYQRAKGRLTTLDAQTFGLAIEQMKGLGALSNAEGQKVQAAYTRATNPLIDEDDARVAWEEVRNRLNRAREKSRAMKQTAILPQDGGAAAPAAADNTDLSTMSDEELQRIANGG